MAIWDHHLDKLYKDFKKNGHRGSTFQKTFSGGSIKHFYDATPKDERLELVKDPDFGNLPKLHGYSQSTLRSLFYIRQIEKYFDPKVVKHMTDFGAGYGNFVRVFDAIFKTRSYSIVDFPKVQEIQKEYLDFCGIEVEYGETMNDLSDFDSPALFVATHSLSECPLEVREEVEKILPRYEYIYIVYNSKIDKINNVEYFEKLSKRLSESYTTEINFNELTAKRSLIAVKK